MNFFGGIGFIAALKNYKTAKTDYEDAVDKKETLEAAILNYTQWRDKKFDEMDDYNPNANNPLEGVLVTFIFRVGNLVGKYCRAKTSVVLTNTTSNNYSINRCEAMVRLFGVQMQYNKTQKKNTNILLKSGETIEIDLPGGVAQIPEEARGRTRDAICDAAGKKLITSCPKISLNDIATADVRIFWRAMGGAGTSKTSRYVDVPGTLRYCMEAYYPK